MTRDKQNCTKEEENPAARFKRDVAFVLQNCLPIIGSGVQIYLKKGMSQADLFNKLHDFGKVVGVESVANLRKHFDTFCALAQEYGVCTETINVMVQESLSEDNLKLIAAEIESAQNWIIQNFIIFELILDALVLGAICINLVQCWKQIKCGSNLSDMARVLIPQIDPKVKELEAEMAQLRVKIERFAQQIGIGPNTTAMTSQEIQQYKLNVAKRSAQMNSFQLELMSLCGLYDDLKCDIDKMEYQIGKQTVTLVNQQNQLQKNGFVAAAQCAVKLAEFFASGGKVNNWLMGLKLIVSGSYGAAAAANLGALYYTKEKVEELRTLLAQLEPYRLKLANIRNAIELLRRWLLEINQNEERCLELTHAAPRDQG